jgi:hypothetical protein
MLLDSLIIKKNDIVEKKVSKNCCNLNKHGFRNQKNYKRVFSYFALYYKTILKYIMHNNVYLKFFVVSFKNLHVFHYRRV